MMQTTNNLTTNIIIPMFGWIVKHFQGGKQIFHVFVLHRGPILKKKMEDECKLNKFFFYKNLVATCCITKSLPLNTYKHSLSTCWIHFQKIYSLITTPIVAISVFLWLAHFHNKFILAQEAYHTYQIYYKLCISFNAPSHQHLPY